MKYYSALRTLLLVVIIATAGYLVHDIWQYHRFVKKVEAINARIDYLHHVKGYNVLDAKHITDVEFGLTPADPEYNALIKE